MSNYILPLLIAQKARFSTPVQTGPGAHPASCTMGTGSFLGVKSGWGVTLTSHPLLLPWSKKGTAIALLTLWAVRPVQSLSACTRVHFTLSPRKANISSATLSFTSCLTLKRKFACCPQIVFTVS